MSKFVVKKRNTFSWPIELKEPAAGAYDSQKIDLEFHKFSDDQIKEMFKDPGTDKAVCKKIIAGWSNVTDEEFKEIPFSVKALDELLNNAKYASAIVNQYLKILQGIVEKN